MPPPIQHPMLLQNTSSVSNTPLLVINCIVSILKEKVNPRRSILMQLNLCSLYLNILSNTPKGINKSMLLSFSLIK